MREATPTFVLPSGKSVRLTKGADPQRPWEACQVGRDFVVSRPRRGDATAQELYRAEETSPLVLSKADATALVEALNVYVRPRVASMLSRREKAGVQGQDSQDDRALPRGS